MKKFIEDGVGITINEHTVKKIKELYVNYGYDKEMINADRRAMNKIIPNATARTNAHFEIAIADADKERQAGMCELRK